MDRDWIRASFERNVRILQEAVKSEEPFPWRRVNRAALDALIEYADAKRQQADSEFLCSWEHESSQQEFDQLIAALDQA